jgi:hypothetical protein
LPPLPSTATDTASSSQPAERVKSDEEEDAEIQRTIESKEATPGPEQDENENGEEKERIKKLRIKILRRS